MWAQHGVPLGERPHPDLDEVGRIPGQLQLGRRHRGDDVEAAARNVAVDLLLVLMHQDHVGISGGLSQGSSCG